MIAVGDSYNIRLWSTQTGRELKPLVGNEIQWSMEFSPDGSRLLSGGNGKVNVWDTKKGAACPRSSNIGEWLHSVYSHLQRRQNLRSHRPA